MLRKFVLATAAFAALGVASLASAAPAAAGWHGHHHWGPRFIARPVVVVSDYGCWRKRIIETPYGVIVKRVNVCY